jgi:pimeloyl-ACP methyl ester carboxylesterase
MLELIFHLICRVKSILALAVNVIIYARSKNIYLTAKGGDMQLNDESLKAIAGNEPTNLQRSRRFFLASAALTGVALANGGCSTLGVGGGTNPGEIRQGSFATSDGAKLNYLESGRGRPIVMIPGWSQTAEMFSDQISAFSANYRVIALDMRGHGDSSKPEHGYRMARLAKDLHEFLDGMNLSKATLVGHSMGCSVIWSHWNLFGNHRTHSMILIDQAPCTTFGPSWTDAEKAETGAVFSPQSLYDTATALAGMDGEATTAGLVNGMFFTKDYPEAKKKYALAQNLKFPRKPAAALLVDHCVQDWRDTISRINVPTLVVGAKGSFFNPKSQEWIASKIPGAKVEIFGVEEGGSHFMFMENSQKFNKIALSFLAST